VSRDQKTIKKCSAGDKLKLIREPKNPADTRAIQAVHKGRLIGYVPAEMAKKLAPLIDQGAKAEARIDEVTGGIPGYKPTRGVNITLTVRG